MEPGPVEAIFADPKEAYTKVLVAAAFEGMVLDTGRHWISAANSMVWHSE